VFQLNIFAAVFNRLQEFKAEKHVHRMFTVHSEHEIRFARNCPNFVIPNIYGAAVETCILVESERHSDTYQPVATQIWRRDKYLFNETLQMRAHL
jgi:hypothetical protein